MPLYISYGMPKTGSTFAFQLVCEILTVNGFEQTKLQVEAIEEHRRRNFVDRWTAPRLQEVLAAAEARGGWVAIKTHAGPIPEIVTALESGMVRAHAIYRDPRDMALSLVDAGAWARERGRRAFVRIETLEDAKRDIRLHMANFDRWAALPGVVLNDYAEVAFATQTPVRAWLDQLGMTASVSDVISRVRRANARRVNKGVPSRHTQELNAAQNQEFLDEFGGFIERYCRSAASRRPAPHADTLGAMGSAGR